MYLLSKTCKLFIEHVCNYLFKVELENTLEQEQEALVNKLWKRMDKLEAEKRTLQIKLDQPVSDPASPRDMSNGDTAKNLTSHIRTLR